MDVIQKHGYELHCLTIFQEILIEFLQEMERLERENEEFYNHPSFKLFECVTDSILENVPRNPDAKEFRLGKTLDNLSKDKKNYKSWRRVKKGIPQRYRLFFKFNSTPPKTIVYAWLNDDRTLRKSQSKSDVYAVFTRMLDKGDVPTSWNALLEAAEPMQVELEAEG